MDLETEESTQPSAETYEGLTEPADTSAPVTPEADDFGDAFAEATGEPAKKPAEKPAPAPAPEPAPAPVEDPNKVVAPEVATAAAKGEPAPAPAPVAAKSDIPSDLDPKFLAQAIAEEQQKLNQKPPETQAEPAQQKTYTSDDFIQPPAKAQIDKFRTEWPDEFPAIEAMIEARAQAMYVNGQNALIGQLNPIIESLTSQLAQANAFIHNQGIEKAVPDVAAITPQVLEWVKSKPTYLQQAYQNVLQNGDAKSIIELLSEFKASTGQTGAATPPASSAVQEPVKPAAAKKPVSPAVAAALAAVPAATRAQPTNAADPSDYNTAFDEAIAAQA